MVSRSVLIAALALALCGCVPRVVTKYVTVEVERVKYVEVDPELTNPHPIAEGPPSACPDVAAKRADQLRQCNIDKALIRLIEGSAKPSELNGD